MANGIGATVPAGPLSNFTAPLSSNRAPFSLTLREKQEQESYRQKCTQVTSLLLEAIPPLSLFFQIGRMVHALECHALAYQLQFYEHLTSQRGSHVPLTSQLSAAHLHAASGGSGSGGSGSSPLAQLVSDQLRALPSLSQLAVDLSHIATDAYVAPSASSSQPAPSPLQISPTPSAPSSPSSTPHVSVRVFCQFFFVGSMDFLFSGPRGIGARLTLNHGLPESGCQPEFFDTLPRHTDRFTVSDCE